MFILAKYKLEVSMKAIIWGQYGPPEVLQLEDVSKPLPKDKEVLIRIHSAGISAGDCETRSLSFGLLFRLVFRIIFGISKPRNIILGQEFSGIIESSGKDATLYKPGDKVFGTTGLHFGAYAEYICVPERSNDALLSTSPKNLTLEKAACLPLGGLEALHFMRKSHLEKGQHILINGAGGSIGTAAIQMAKQIGAIVTAVDSTEKHDLLRDIGADHVIDYTMEDFTKNSQQYDVIFDVVGKTNFTDGLSSTRGHYVIGNPKLSLMLKAMFANITTNKKVYIGASTARYEDLVHIRDLAESGKLTTYIDKKYAMEDIVAAHKYIEAGHKKGNLVLQIME
jgi:NADPH:quinone reductase-like Zn-dependent oxidoreductase